MQSASSEAIEYQRPPATRAPTQTPEPLESDGVIGKIHLMSYLGIIFDYAMIFLKAPF